MNLSSKSLALVVFSLSAACDSQVDGRYEGEPLATLQGDITTLALSAPAGSSGSRLAVVWTPQVGTTASGEDLLQAQSTEVTVTGSFPASFELDLFEPPPESAMWEATYGNKTVKRAQGVFMVLDAAAPLDTASRWDELWAQTRGAETKYNIVYVSEAVPADPVTGNPALAKGYNLTYGVNRLPPGDGHVPTAAEIAQCFENQLTSYGVIVPDMTRYCDRSYGGFGVAPAGTKLTVKMGVPATDHPFFSYLPLAW